MWVLLKVDSIDKVEIPWFPEQRLNPGCINLLEGGWIPLRTIRLVDELGCHADTKVDERVACDLMRKTYFHSKTILQRQITCLSEHHQGDLKEWNSLHFINTIKAAGLAELSCERVSFAQVEIEELVLCWCLFTRSIISGTVEGEKQSLIVGKRGSRENGSKVSGANVSSMLAIDSALSTF